MRSKKRTGDRVHALPHAGVALLGILLISSSAVAAGPTHPLDPLTGQEIEAAVAILAAAGKSGPATRYPILRLQEPSKKVLQAWRPGQPFRREAFVMIFEGAKTFEARVDLDKRRLIAFQEIPGVQPPILMEEYMLAHGVAVSDPGFQAALAKRNITDLDSLICMPLSAGYDGVPEEEGRRLLRVACLQAADTSNAWSRPIENLTAVVDLNNKVVVRVVDSGVVPMATTLAEFPPAVTRAPPNPLDVVQPSGPDARIEGNQVTWDRWSFHVRVEQREGVILSRVAYDESGTRRSVVHRAALGEIFVPYADVTSNWYFRTYMDEGEYGFGKSVQSLTPSIDCPANAQFIDVVLPDDFGTPYQVPRGLCVFERTPHMAVRHFDIFTGQTLSLPGRELVVRFVTVVGNYDYMMDWVFAQDGSIELKVGAGGVIAVKGVSSDTAQGAKAKAETIYGPLVDHKLAGVMHQHFFNVRLDMDVDGTQNSVVELNRKLVPANIGLRRSGWTYEENLFEREHEAFSHGGHHHHSQLLVVNTSRKNKLGYPTGYQVETHGNEQVLMTSQDSALQRAAFVGRELWVTPYSPKEMYSAGDYPNQSKPGDGLPSWTAGNRSIKNKDVVLWVNVGLGHVPRSEDWPVMPTEWFGSVKLSPFMFFDRNPAIDLSPAR